MSFATLSPDVYDEITSHLVGDRVRGKRRPIALGKVLSLVCKTLRPIGQGLVWSDVNLDYSKFAKTPPEVFLNFDIYTHLHPLVVRFITSNEKIPSTSKSTKLTRIVIKMVQHCHKLEAFCTKLPNHTKSTQVRQLFRAASCLEALTLLALPHAPIVLDSEVVKIFHLAFPHLEYLAICLTIPTDGDNVLSHTKPEATRSGQLKYLTLEVYDVDPESLQILRILILLASALDTSILSEFRLSGTLLHPQTLYWLTLDLFYIRNVCFTIDPDDSQQSLSHLLHWLPQLGRLSTLSINPQMTDDEHRASSVKSPFTLLHLLAAVPLSIHLVLLKGIHFFGSPSYPETRLKPSALALIEGPSLQIYLKTSSSHTFVTLKKMKDKKGISRWYRVIDT